MSRRRDPARAFAHRELITVDVECRRGHLIGRVLKTLILDDDGVSPFGFEPDSRLVFVDEAPSADSGYVTGRCARCDDVARVGWRRIRNLFDVLEAAGRSTGEISPNE